MILKWIFLCAFLGKLQQLNSAFVPESEKLITEEIYFYHYSRKCPEVSTELKIGSPLNDDININLPWKFFIHGWTTDPVVSPWFHTGKEAYFKAGDYNIVFVDWSKPGNQTYLESCINAIGSGKYVGKFILHLVDNGVSLDNIHLLSHSLGSHMAGFAGQHVLNTTNNKIGRITGLDPAGPFYEFNPLLRNMTKPLLPANARLSPDDAKFVDIIHTDSGLYGIRANIGHIDFHPNSGKRLQPGCETTEDENCSHARSTQFFVESITNNNFIARKCDSYNNYINGFCANNEATTLGEYTDQSARGSYYLTTNSEPPFALEEYDYREMDFSNAETVYNIQIYQISLIVLISIINIVNN